MICAIHKLKKTTEQDCKSLSSHLAPSFIETTFLAGQADYLKLQQLISPTLQNP